jgi:hypothetical protein
MNLRPATIRRIEQRAFNRAADLAKSYAEHWEREASTAKRRQVADDWSAAIKAGHWRIIEKAIRDLAHQPKADDEAA